MAEHVNRWNPYAEVPTETHRDPVKDDHLIYGVNVPHFTVTVYSPDGRVNKYWNARILEDMLGYCRIACPRDGKILKFKWSDWSVYIFTHDGLNELVFAPKLNSRSPQSLWSKKGVK